MPSASTFSNPPVSRASLLEEAGRYIRHDRNANYGDPEDNFAVIAAIMAAYLTRRFGIPIPLAPYDVANLMFAVKLGRLANNPLHHDSYVDMAGYAAAGGEVAARHNTVTRIDTAHIVGAAATISGDMLRELEEFWSDEEGPDA